jgi:hypothetical protein
MKRLSGHAVPIAVTANLFRLLSGILIALILELACGAQSSQNATLPDTPNAALESQSFPRRLADFYRQDWFGPASSDPAPLRRGLPSPLDSPPFPSADWSYGGSPVLGEPDTNSYPLMSAWNGAKSRTKVYGWVEPTVNGSTSSHSNSPEGNDAYANRVELDQAVIYVERLPDTVQRKKIDYGFHFTGFYGTDYRYTTDRGYLSSQLVKHHYRYGFDPVLEYFDLYLPSVARGMNIRVGRFISIPGIEAQLSPNNYIFSHSLLYAVDPFTDTGVLATIQLNDQWLVQFGLTGGHDVALWVPDAKPSFTGCVSHTSKTVKDNVYLCANGINDGEYAYNNVQQYDATWYHKFSKTWHSATEAYLMYERDVPSVSGTIKPEANSNAATCRPGLERCLAPEYAFTNYLNKQLGPRDFASFRSDLLNDKKGQRTGVNTKYTENTLMLSHWIGSTVQIRPEIRLDHAWDRKSYDDGRRKTQFTAASDLILHF